MNLSLGQQIDLAKHELSRLKPDRNDYAGACSALLFAIDRYDDYVTWMQNMIGRDPAPKAGLTATLVRLDELAERR